MSLSLQTVLLLVLGAFVGSAVGLTLNNLNPVPEFPGKNRLLWRITGCLTFVPVAVAALMDEAVTGSVRVVCWVATGAIAMALLYDGEKLLSAVRAERARRRDPAESAISTTVGYAPELRVKLLAEMSRQVEQRLKSAYGEQTLVNLEMHPAPDDVEGETRAGNVFLVPKPKQVVENLKDGRMRVAQSEETILDTFDDKAILGQLLILGAPGSGKTTALLNLAQALLKRAETGREIPYIFELSAWPKTEPDIASWLMTQLEFEHGIKETVSREWILNGQLLPLLDGLDELATDRRQACIEKINEFVTSQLGRQVVVCCRTKVYEASGKKLESLSGTLRIQPLAIGQVQDYFERVNPEVWEALQDKAGLGELLKPPASGEEPALLQIPLFLQILAITYEPEEKISTKEALLDAYVARRLSRKICKQDRKLARKRERTAEWAYKTTEDEPDFDQTVCYLRWLSQKMKEHDIPNNFLIEQMQPSWLPKRGFARYYSGIISFINSAAITLIIFAFIGLVDDWDNAPISALFFGSAFSLVEFWKIDKSEIRPVEILRLRKQKRRDSGIRTEVLKHIVRCTIFGLLAGLVFGSSLSFFVIAFAIFNGEMTSLLSSTITLRAALMVVLTQVVIVSIPLTAFSAIVGTIFGLFDGIVGPAIDEFKEKITIRRTPNQGIVASARNCFLVASFSFPFCLILSFLMPGSKPIDSLIIGVLFSMYFGFYKSGGLPVVQHHILRFFLLCQGHIPYNYAKFLKYTTERRLTQQVGGSFRFIHRELLDHFVNMHVDPKHD